MTIILLYRSISEKVKGAMCSLVHEAVLLLVMGHLRRAAVRDELL